MFLRVPIGDGGKPSPSGEARFGVTWSGATLPTGRAHEKRSKGSSGVGSEIPKANSDRGCSDSCGRPAAANRREHELEIVSGKVARDHVHLFVSYRPNQPVSQMVQRLKGISSRVLLQ